MQRGAYVALKDTLALWPFIMITCLPRVICCRCRMLGYQSGDDEDVPVHLSWTSAVLVSKFMCSISNESDAYGKSQEL